MESRDEELVCLTTCGTVFEAKSLQAWLQSHDLDSFVQGEHHRALMGPFGQEIALRLLVPRWRLETARAILEARSAPVLAGETDLEDDDGSEGDIASERPDPRRRLRWIASLLLAGPIAAVVIRLVVWASRR